MSVQRRVRELRQLQRLLREPRARCRVDDAPLGVDRPAGAAGAGAVGLARHLHPEIGVDQGVAGIRGRRNAETTSGWITPVLSGSGIRVLAPVIPRAEAVTARVDDEVSRPRRVSRILKV